MKLSYKSTALSIVLIVCLIGCKENPQRSSFSFLASSDSTAVIQYAKGFKIEYFETYKVNDVNSQKDTTILLKY
jgi:hypothetical protein